MLLQQEVGNKTSLKADTGHVADTGHAADTKYARQAKSAAGARRRMWEKELFSLPSRMITN